MSTDLYRLYRKHAAWTRVWPSGLINDDDDVNDDDNCLRGESTMTITLTMTASGLYILHYTFISHADDAELTESIHAGGVYVASRLYTLNSHP